MNTKSLFQILIPFGCTVLLWIVLGIISLLFSLIGYLLSYALSMNVYIDNIVIEVIKNITDFFYINIFKLEDNYGNTNGNTIFFWIVNVILIIIVELWATGSIEEEEKKESNS